MKISLLDNSFSESISVSINNLSIDNIDLISKKVTIVQNIVNENNFLIKSKIYIDNISLPILPLILS